MNQVRSNGRLAPTSRLRMSPGAPRALSATRSQTVAFSHACPGFTGTGQRKEIANILDARD